jgi:hypothetical protein
VKKSEYRVVIIADAYDPDKLVERLLGSGIRAEDVHLSHDRCSRALIDRGVRFDVPCGVLRVESMVPCEEHIQKRAECRWMFLP